MLRELFWSIGGRCARPVEIRRILLAGTDGHPHVFCVVLYAASLDGAIYMSGEGGTAALCPGRAVSSARPQRGPFRPLFCSTSRTAGGPGLAALLPLKASSLILFSLARPQGRKAGGRGVRRRCRSAAPARRPRRHHFVISPLLALTASARRRWLPHTRCRAAPWFAFTQATAFLRRPTKASRHSR